LLRKDAYVGYLLHDFLLPQLQSLPFLLKLLQSCFLLPGKLNVGVWGEAERSSHSHRVVVGSVGLGQGGCIDLLLQYLGSLEMYSYGIEK
jgi:hypothetical protein